MATRVAVAQLVGFKFGMVFWCCDSCVLLRLALACNCQVIVNRRAGTDNAKIWKYAISLRQKTADDHHYSPPVVFAILELAEKSLAAA
jgi:hypothetical protein